SCFTYKEVYLSRNTHHLISFSASQFLPNSFHYRTCTYIS
ncbi:unnamed protein product, partial [Schistosoma curassoni]|uniref:Ovule protein n=1 Tax=Schistosoma curassoni TaxID=6186 RepID=A0A183KPR8_9TREM